MTDLKLNSANLRRYRIALVVLGLLSIALMVHEVFGEHGLLALRRSRRQYEALQQEINSLKKENQQLENEIKALKSDPKAIERLAREQMRLAKPGEIIYIMPDKDPRTTPPPSTAQQKTDAPSR